MFAMILENPRSLFHKVLIIAVLVTPSIDGCAVNPTTPAACPYTVANGANENSIAAAPGGLAAAGCPAALVRTADAMNTCTLASGGTGTITGLCAPAADPIVGSIAVASSVGTVGPITGVQATDTVMVTCTAGNLKVVSSRGSVTQNSVTGLTLTCN